MFKSLEMKKAHIFVLDKDVKKVSHVLYDLKLMEFFSINKEQFGRYESEKLSNESASLLTLRSTITLLKKYVTKPVEGQSVEDAPKKAQELQEKVSKLEKETLHLKDDMKRQKILVHLKVSKSDLEKNTTVGFIPLENADNLNEFKKLKISCKTYKDKENERVYFAAKTKKIPFTFKEFYLPSKVEVSVASKLKTKEQELKKLNDQFEHLANGNLRPLQKEELQLSKKLATHEAKSHFTKTENITVLSGYIPKSQEKKLKRTLETEIGNKFDFETEAADEDAPIQLDNGALSSKFETILKMYSLPRYGELDPTLLFFLVFPIFYGFILGDFGYGLLSLIVFTLAKTKLPKLKDFLSILQISSISSMAFGILYGEYFGFEPYHLFTRAYHPETLLAIAVIFGVLHINLGLAFGFFNNIKHSIKKAVCDNLSWVVLQIAAVVLYLGYKVTPSTTLQITGYALLLLSLVLIYLGHGFVGLIEVPSFFTNILSYARLMAVGLSSVVIAVLVNTYTKTFFEMGAFGIVAGILLFTLGHIFNIILGNFESFLHTLRLHYVEFFTKFYQGGGREFKPFGSRLHDLEEEH